MDKIRKALQRLSPKERGWVSQILIALRSQNYQGLDIKKLKGREDILRARKGDIRIIFRKDGEQVLILAIKRRSESTYQH